MPDFAANLSTMFTEVCPLRAVRRRGALRLRRGRARMPYAVAKETTARLAARARSRPRRLQPAGRALAGGERGIACHPGRVAEFAPASPRRSTTPLR